MKTKFSKFMAVLMCAAMLVGTMPTMVSAASNKTSFTESQLSVVTNKASTLATGVTQDLYTVYDKNGDQVKMFVTTADMDVDTVELFASYKDMDPTNYGMSNLTEQVAAFNEKVAAGDEYYKGTVVAGINSSYYNMTTGKPTGTFVMNGIDVTTESEGNKYGYFAVMKDGSVKIGNKGEYSSDKGNIQEAIGIYTMLIVDGEIVEGLDSKTKYPRQTIGITADNKVILMTADGNQAPSTVGLTIQEQAQVMYDLGCVWAGHLDGGGSATYASKAEGSDVFKVTNSPSDGSERSISNGFIIVSTEAASNEFSRVSYDVESEYVTPGTSTSVSVNGVSSTGNSAEIPADITYEVTNGTYVDGVFTAGNAEGEATITAMYNGNAVGSTTINVVLPTKLSFDSTSVSVPYGKTVELALTATYGVNEVTIKTSDIKFSLADDTIGTIDGFNFTATNEVTDVTSTTVTASIIGTDVTAEAEISLGKGSEVLFDFEDQKLQFALGYGKYNYYLPNSTIGIADANNGKVHNGNYSLKLNIDYTNSLESGYQLSSLQNLGEDIVLENVKRIGMWLWVPDEYVGSWIRWTISGAKEVGGTYSKVNGQDWDDGTGGTGVVSTLEESGWHYLSVDVSSYASIKIAADSYFVQFYICDRDNASFNYYFKNQHNVNGNYTLYVDDVTVDYSSAVGDREAPVFSSLTYATTSMSDAVALTKDTVPTVNNNVVSFSAKVAENTKKSNYTGLDTTTAKAYVDGTEVACTYKNGTISIDKNTVFADGQHTVKFSICDKVGNYASIIRKINVEAGNTTTIKVVPHDENLNRMLLGSVYYVDIVSTDIEKVDKISVTLDLDNMNTWELSNMDVAEGFEATYSLDKDENIATINVERTGYSELSGEQALVSIPIRIWTLTNPVTVGTKTWTLAAFFASKEFWPIYVDITVDKGVVTYIDGTTDIFTGEGVLTQTEMWANYGNMTATTEGTEYYNNWNGGHLHSAVAIEDKEATCIENGYANRTFCEECNSVVDWGTTYKATGHKFDIVDDVLKCSCGITYNGVHTDGKTYADGVCLQGWIDDSYYVDGVALKGVKLVDGYYYNFGNDGVCDGQTKYTGLFYDEEAQGYRYSKLGELAGGWHQIDDEWHYFRNYTKVAVTGEYTIEGVAFQFDETGMTKGAWHTTEEGTRYYYGPKYYSARAEGYKTLVEIDGKIYNFNLDGYITPGTWALRDSTAFKKEMFEFAEDGSLINQITEQGVATDSNGDDYYINENGIIPMDAGIVQFNDDYYYVVHSGKVKKNTNQAVTEEKANGLVEAGTYYFGEDGKMVVPEVKNGIVEGYYYLDGEIKGDVGMINIDGDLYYVCYSGKIKKGSNQTVTEAKANGLVEPGIYYFGEDGKMVIPEKDTEVKNGIVDGYYYLDGEIKGDVGMIEIDGDLYYVCYSGKIKKGSNQTVTEAKANGLVEPGIHYFGEDGKMVVSEVKNGIVDGYYYLNDEIKGDVGMIEIDGELYYVCYSGKIKKGSNQTVTEAKANGLVEPGIHYFGDDGKMVK